jgi:hypothetical protein
VVVTRRNPARAAGSDRPRGLWGTRQRPAWCQ